MTELEPYSINTSQMKSCRLIRSVKQQLVELSLLSEEEKQKAQKEHEEQMTTLKSQYDEKLRGLIPVSVRQNLESMISIPYRIVSSLKHHNTVLVQLLQLHKDLSPNIPVLSAPQPLFLMCMNINCQRTQQTVLK